MKISVHISKKVNNIKFMDDWKYNYKQTKNETVAKKFELLNPDVLIPTPYHPILEKLPIGGFEFKIFERKMEKKIAVRYVVVSIFLYT